MGRPRCWEPSALDPNDPSGVSTVTFTIPQSTVDFITRGKLSSRWFRIICVHRVLLAPDAVFQGWNRDGFEAAMCYVGRPQDCPKEGIEVPPPPGKQFMVYVTPGGRIEEWGWAAFDPNNGDDCEKHFGKSWRRIWPPT